jgi:hypothetical protein
MIKPVWAVSGGDIEMLSCGKKGMILCGDELHREHPRMTCAKEGDGADPVSWSFGRVQVVCRGPFRAGDAAAGWTLC